MRALSFQLADHQSLLKLGVGTGLICDRLLEVSGAGLRIAGIDHTETMLAQARIRLGGRARLVRQNILDKTTSSAFDAAYWRRMTKPGR
ncbi:methyltransferase domain-containing protein [Streptomyces sp. NPDC059037]|uniref:methyltransferase domain-containing protein n=1 Tax=Streptomyces sp. NPDC059037 TaxID=3346710 RepID=UPI0036BB11C2